MDESGTGRGRRVFLSYGHDRHAATAVRIKGDLERRGHEVWFDLDRLQAGRDWEAYIEEGLEWARSGPKPGCVVLLMTPHSVRRPGGFCLNEIARALSLSLSVVPIMADTCEPPLSICRLQWLDLRGAAPEASPERYAEALERLFQAIERGVADFEGTQSRLLRALDPLAFDADVGVQQARFTGRRWLIARFDAWIAEPGAPRVFRLTGSPGVGKTAFATWLAANRASIGALHLCRSESSTKADPRRCVTSVAYQLSSQLPTYMGHLATRDLDRAVRESNPDALFDELIVQPLWKHAAPTRGRVAVLIDGLDEASREGRNLLAELLAHQFRKTPDWLRLVLTTRPEEEVTQALRHKDFPPQEVVDLREASRENEEDIREFLRREVPRFASAGRDPADAVDRIVARSAGSFLYAECILDALEKRDLSLDRLDEFPDGLSGVYRQNFRRYFPDPDAYARREGPALDLLVAAAEPLAPAFVRQTLGWSERDVGALQRRLASLFPVRDGRFVPFHRSVVEWLVGPAGEYRSSLRDGHHRLAESGLAAWRGAPRALPDYHRRHLPHHLHALGRTEEAVEVLSDLALLESAWQEGRRYAWMAFWRRVGDGADAGARYSAALDRLEASGTEPLRVARAADVAGAFLREMGSLSAARSALERALRLREAALGPHAVEVSNSLRNLGEIHRVVREFEPALSLYRRALAIREEGARGDHVDLVEILHGLGELHQDLGELRQDLGEYRDAVECYGRALAMAERLHEEHWVATCLNDIGTAYYETDRASEALPMHERALGIWRRIHGPDHPDAAAAIYGIALCRSSIRAADPSAPVDETFAWDLHLQALEVHERTFPPFHPKVERCRRAVRDLLRIGMCTPRAPDLAASFLAAKCRVYGTSHRETLLAREDVVWWLLAAGHLAAAVAEARRVLESSGGTAWEDPHREAALRHLGGAPSAAPEDAWPFLWRATEVLERNLAADEVPVVACRAAADAALGVLVGRAAAAPAVREYLAMRSRTFGPKDPRTATAHARVTWVLFAEGTAELAVETARASVRAHEAAHGPMSRPTANAWNALARCLQRAGAHDEAADACRHALAIRESIADSPPSETATALNNLGLSLVHLDRLDQAEAPLLRATELDASTPNPYYWLARLYRRRGGPGDRERELAALKACLARGAPDPARRVECVARLRELGEDAGS